MYEQAERDGRQTTLEDERNVQWPSRLDCPKCWKADGSWDEETIYLYLFDQYWPDNGRTSQTTRRALFQTTLDIQPDDMDEEDSSLSSAFKIAPFVFLIGLIGYLGKKRSDIKRSGRHKKL